MASVNDGMWMENLEVFVFDEKKAVTYKWLSRSLKVHVNVAKQMLFEFAQKYKAKVSCVYLLAGTTSNNNFSVKLAKEENLEKCESLFSTLTSKHVHTVAASTGVDLILSQINLLNVDMAVRKEGKPTTAFSGIINKLGVPRSERMVEEVPPKQVDVKKEPLVPPPKQNPKSGIEGMFDKQKEKADAKSSNPPNVPSKPVIAKKIGGIAGMFAKQTATSVTKKAPSSESVAKVESPEVSPGKENLSNHLKEKEEEKTMKCEPEKEAPPKKRVSSQKFEKPSKRRKRIQVLSDSDSSDKEDSNKEDDPASPPPPQATKIESDEDDEIIPSTPVEKDGKPHRRVRKIVKKTYLGEDGYMVTKMEMGSCSEDETPVELPSSTKLTPALATSAEKNVKPSSASTNSSSGGKSKQASIRNFFQKK